MEENQDVMSKLQLPPDIPTFAFRKQLLELDLYFTESQLFLCQGMGEDERTFFFYIFFFFI